MKKNTILISSILLSLLVVGCSNASSSLPSSSSTSSVSSSSSSTSSTSQTPVNTKKVSFNQIGSLVAQVVDAKALGVSNSKDTASEPKGRRQAQDDTVGSSEQNKMVKVTETYNPTTKVAEDKTIEVTFTRTTNTQTTELQTGMDTYVATAENITIERLTDEPGRVVIQNVPNYEFRALNGDILLQDWTSTEGETITFTFEETITIITLESRSTDASISFTAFEGFTYEVKSGETMIKENLKDNQEGDLNQKDGVITIKGLTQGLPYDVHYEGYVVLETITQDEVDGQVDKLFVLYNYTFVSFVPLTLNTRPEASLLEKDNDDIALYDKTNYFSDTTRQSFIVDNENGLIYKIEGINILSLSGGCAQIQGSQFPYDILINSDESLIFKPLHQNPNISTFSCIKDKFGNKFIKNDKLNLYDSENNAYYFVNDGVAGNVDYDITKEGVVIEIEYDSGFTLNSSFSGQVVLNDGAKRPFLITDNYNFLPQKDLRNHYPIKISSGILLSHTNGLNYYKTKPSWEEAANKRTSLWTYYYDGINDITKAMYLYGNLDVLYETSFIKEYNVVLEYSQGKLYAFYNFWESFLTNDKTDYVNKKLLDLENFSPTLLIENITFEEGKIIKFGLSGNVYYDLIPEYKNNRWVITPYESGTFVAPSVPTITFQPINR
jgi:hypothetical protein